MDNKLSFTQKGCPILVLLLCALVGGYKYLHSSLSLTSLICIILFIVTSLFFISPKGRTLWDRYPLIRSVPILLSTFVVLSVLLPQFYTYPVLVSLVIFVDVIAILGYTPVLYWSRYYHRFTLIAGISCAIFLLVDELFFKETYNKFDIGGNLISILITFVVLLSLSFMIKRVLHITRDARGLNINIGKSQPPEVSFTNENLERNLRFLGITIKFYHSGKWSKITISNE